MLDMNQWIGIGRLTKDPEIKKVKVRGEDVSVCNFSLAVGDGKDEVSFFEITCWNKVAENVDKYCSKGKLVCVSGRLKQDRWEKDGEKRTKVKIVNAMVQFLTPKPKDGEAAKTDSAPSDHRDGMDGPPQTESDMPPTDDELGWD